MAPRTFHIPQSARHKIPSQGSIPCNCNPFPLLDCNSSFNPPRCIIIHENAKCRVQSKAHKKNMKLRKIQQNSTSDDSSLSDLHNGFGAHSYQVAEICID
jgi:hypothetical protein